MAADSAPQSWPEAQNPGATGAANTPGGPAGDTDSREKLKDEPFAERGAPEKRAATRNRS